MRSGIRRLKGQAVVVTLLSGELIEGVMVDAYSDCIALRHPRNLTEDQDMKGDMLIPLERIDYYQEQS